MSQRLAGYECREQIILNSITMIKYWINGVTVNEELLKDSNMSQMSFFGSETFCQLDILPTRHFVNQGNLRVSGAKQGDNGKVF